MSQSPYQLEPMKGRCTVTGRAFAEGEEFYTVLFEDGDSFRREDYSLESWSGPPEGAYCFFKSRMPVKEKRARLLVDDDVLMNFFTRLADEREAVRVQFRFVLALILMRKRLLRYESSEIVDGVEVWIMTAPRDRSAHRVVNPRLSDDQIEGVSRELSAILHGDTMQMIEEMEPASEETEDAQGKAGATGSDESTPGGVDGAGEPSSEGIRS